jgi:hypothetical protein
MMVVKTRLAIAPKRIQAGTRTSTTSGHNIIITQRDKTGLGKNSGQASCICHSPNWNRWGHTLRAASARCAANQNALEIEIVDFSRGRVLRTLASFAYSLDVKTQDIFSTNAENIVKLRKIAA